MAAVDPVAKRGDLLPLKQIVQLVEDDLLAVERLVAEQISSDVRLVGEVGRYLQQGGGKRIRPALLLLACRLLGHRSERAVLLGAVVEFIHTATLLHDDIIDEATTRRGRKPAPTTAGATTSRCCWATSSTPSRWAWPCPRTTCPCCACSPR